MFVMLTLFVEFEFWVCIPSLQEHILQRDASNIFYQDRKDHEQEVLTNYSCRNLTNQVADMLGLSVGSYPVIYANKMLLCGSHCEGKEGVVFKHSSCVMS